METEPLSRNVYGPNGLITLYWSETDETWYWFNGTDKLVDVGNETDAYKILLIIQREAPVKTTEDLGLKISDRSYFVPRHHPITLPVDETVTEYEVPKLQPGNEKLQPLVDALVKERNSYKPKPVEKPLGPFQWKLVDGSAVEADENPEAETALQEFTETLEGNTSILRHNVDWHWVKSAAKPFTIQVFEYGNTVKVIAVRNEANYRLFDRMAEFVTPEPR